MFLLLSQISIEKEGFFQEEIKEGLKRLSQIPPGRIFLIPTRLDDCKPLHRELNELTWLDLFPDWDEGTKKIEAIIEHHRQIKLEGMRKSEELVKIDTPAHPIQSKSRERDRSKSHQSSSPMAMSTAMNFFAPSLPVSQVVALEFRRQSTENPADEEHTDFRDHVVEFQETISRQLYNYFAFIAQSPRAKKGLTYDLTEAVTDAIKSILDLRIHSSDKEQSKKKVDHLLKEIASEFGEWLGYGCTGRYVAPWSKIRLEDDYLVLMGS